MELTGTEKHKYFLIHLSDAFDAKTLNPVRELIEKAGEKKYSTIIFDMSACVYIDSSAIGLLANLHRKCVDKGGKVGILKPSPHMEQVLSYANMDSLLSVFYSEADIEKDLAQQRE